MSDTEDNTALKVLKIVMTVRDDLSPMIEFRATAQGYIREII